MNTSVIIQIKAGEVPDRDYIEHALRNCPTCFGIAVQNEDGENSSLEIASEARNISVDKLMETLEACKDARVVLTLGNMVQDFNKEDDLMPFVFEQGVEGEDPETILAIFLEGDASDYAKPGEGHTETYHLWEEYIFPILSEKYEASSDLSSFYSKLMTSAFQQSVRHSFKHRGEAVFLMPESDPICVSKNELGAEYAWGSTSNTFKWGEGKKEDKSPLKVVTKAKSRLVSLLGKSDKEGTPPHKTVDKPADKPADPPKEIVSPSDTGMMLVKPPAKLQGNARNAWIRIFTGIYEGPMPPGHASKNYQVAVPESMLPFALEDVSTKDQVRALQKRVKAAHAKSSVEDQVQDPKVSEKPVTPQPTELYKVEAEKRPPSDFLPDLPADVKEGTVNLVTDWATRPPEKMPNALEILRIESKWPAFTTIHGIKPSDMLNWHIADIKELSRKYPDAMALAFLEMKAIALENGAFKDHIDAFLEGGKEKPKETAPPKKMSRLQALTGKAA